MSSSLIDALIAKHGFVSVTEGTLEVFLNANKEAVLFFAGDSGRLVESADVAVILPEILKQFKGRLAPALVEKSAERALQRRYRFNAFPALVFLRDGEYLGAICRLLDWTDYLSEIADILARAPSEPPPYQFPEGCIPSTATNGENHGHDHPGDYQ